MVEVADSAPKINTENATLGDTKDFNQLSQLPVNYRGATTSPLAALATVPGTQQDANGNVSVGGGIPSQVQYSAGVPRGIVAARLRGKRESVESNAGQLLRHQRICCTSGEQWTAGELRSRHAAWSGEVAVAGGLSKTFAIGETVHVKLESTFTNIPNQANFAPPATNVSSPETFGKTTSVQSAENTGNRTGQVALRIEF